MKVFGAILTALAIMSLAEPALGRVKRLKTPPVDPAQQHQERAKDETGSIKYFHESTFDPHLDGRYADGRLPYELHRSSLVLLAQTCLTTLNDIGIETWVMHGSLLGWFWNRRILPWDSDVDLMISYRSMEHLAAHYNMSAFHYRQGASRLRRNYILEINPNYVNGSSTDKNNFIDARWIDTDTGLFLDITALRPNTTAQAAGHDGAMICKDGHHYEHADIYPLRDSTFEGVPAKIPFAYTEVLVEEYHEKALSNVVFNGHQWSEEKKEWMSLHRAPQWPQNTLSSFVPKLQQAEKELGHSTAPEKV